jgi:hypothetical protein
MDARLPAYRSPGYKGNHLFDAIAAQAHTAMSATKFYFYFFWHLRPLADREG